jgi:DNA invertase Pin-like site-specific DNA recombinase
MTPRKKFNLMMDQMEQYLVKLVISMVNIHSQSKGYNMKQTKLTALYIRCSTDKQATGMEAQKRALEKYCNDNDIKDFKVYEDFGISGAKESRPGLDSLISDSNVNKIETVIVYSFSRFARSTSHLLSALNHFKSKDIGFISLSEKLDTNSAMGKAVFTIISAISELERELIAERVRNGLNNAKAKGKKLGRKKTRNSKLIRELAKQNLSQRRIAELVGCSKTTVWRELKNCP